jgi:hypothetical protein
VVLGAGAGVGLTLLGHKPASTAGPAHHGASTGPPSPAPTASSPGASPSPSASLPPRQQAANALAALLARSGTDRSAITQAVTAAQNCSELSQDETVFNNAASSRQSLLNDLNALPNRSALSASMLQDLTTAWQASAQADQAYAKWTQDAISGGCSTSGYSSDANYQAAAAPDQQATTSKQAFTALWSGIASEYNLPDYQWNQI